MKLVNRFSAVTILVLFSLGLAGALILAHGCADLRLFLTPSLWLKNLHDIIPLLALLTLLGGAVVMLCWIAYFTRHVVKTLRKAEEFISGILAGELPPPLSTEKIKEDEIISLFSTLNFMRDRQQNLAERLKWRSESEEKLRREIEYCDDLQLAAFGCLLPEMRRSAGVVKAYTLIELAQARADAKNAVSNGSMPLEQRTMLRSLKRQARLTRELDFLADVAKLERKRWSAPISEDFSASELIRELTDRCQMSLQSRRISLNCEYQSGTPEYLSCDRELLYQLLHLLIRSCARSLAGGASVIFSASGNARNAVFEISDNAADEHREFLVPNYRESTRNKTDLSQCSLSVIALEIVRNISEKTGCLFEAASTEQSPTILRLTVPAAQRRTQPFPEAVPLKLYRRHAEGSPVPPADGGKKLTVLLSDDDAEEARAIEQLFSYDNIQVVTSSGNMQLLSTLSADAVADGIMLAAPFSSADPPQILINRIRRITGKADLPILVITPVHDRALSLELSALPNVWCLVSPLNFAQAVNLLRGNLVYGE